MTFEELDLVAGTTRVCVAPARGCHITSMEVAGRELFYMDRGTFDDPAKSVRGGVPLLFPFCGKLVDGLFTRTGTRIAQHGFGRNYAWSIVERGPAWVRCRFEPPAEARAIFPYDYVAEQTVWAWPGGMQVELAVHSHDARPIPMTPGWHPYFAMAAAEKPNTRLDVIGYPHDKLNNTGEPNFAWPMPGSGVVAATLPGWGSVRIESSENLRILQSWTQAGCDFLCLEPFAEMPNAINDAEAPSVAPGTTRRWWMRLLA